MRRSNAKPAGCCDRGAQEHSPLTPSPTATANETGGPQVGEPDQTPLPSSEAKSTCTMAAAVGAHSRSELQSQQDQRTRRSAIGQSHSVVAGDNTERRVRKRTAMWGIGQCGSRRRYNLRTGRMQSTGMREERFQKEFNAETGISKDGTSSSEVLSSTVTPGGHKRHPVAEGGMTASFIAGEQASATEEATVQGTAGRLQSLAAGGTRGRRDTEIRGQADDGAGVLGCAELKGTSHQSHERGVGNKGSPCGVRKDECGLEMNKPGEHPEHGSEEEMGKAVQAGTAVCSSLAKTAIGNSPPKAPALPVTFPSHTEPEVAADDNATSQAPPRPEQSPAELLHCEPEPSVADIHNDVWVLRILETADEVGSSGFPFATVLPLTGENQPLPWNHQLIQNLSTEPSRPQTHPASAVPDPSDVNAPPSDLLSDSQMNSVVLGELDRDQATGKQEDATHLLCGLVTELSTLNRMVMAAHRELETLRRGRTLKPPLHRPYCPRRPEP